MRRTALIIGILSVLIIPIQWGFALGGPDEGPWERVSLRVGGFGALMNSSIRFGLTEGTGLDVSIEDTLGLDQSLLVLRVDGSWRFTRNLRHRFDVGYAAYLRSATREIQEDFELGDETIEAGTIIDSVYNIHIIKLLYSWSFLQDERVDLGIGAGLYMMPLTVKVTGEEIEDNVQDITAPLPVFDFRMDFVITPKTYFRMRIDAFYIRIGNYVGSIMDYELDYEWRFWKYAGIGIGVESFRMRIEGEGDGSGLGQQGGKIVTNYNGILLYAKFYY